MDSRIVTEPEGSSTPTRRPMSAAAEEILGSYFPVLDHGFVALVDYMGDDASVERGARVSYGYRTGKVSMTRGLLRYLRRHLEGSGCSPATLAGWPAQTRRS